MGRIPIIIRTEPALLREVVPATGLPLIFTGMNEYIPAYAMIRLLFEGVRDPRRNKDKIDELTEGILMIDMPTNLASYRNRARVSTIARYTFVGNGMLFNMKRGSETRFAHFLYGAAVMYKNRANILYSLVFRSRDIQEKLATTYFEFTTSAEDDHVNRAAGQRTVNGMGVSSSNAEFWVDNRLLKSDTRGALNFPGSSVVDQLIAYLSMKGVKITSKTQQEMTQICYKPVAKFGSIDELEDWKKRLTGKALSAIGT